MKSRLDKAAASFSAASVIYSDNLPRRGAPGTHRSPPQRRHFLCGSGHSLGFALGLGASSFAFAAEPRATCFANIGAYLSDEAVSLSFELPRSVDGAGEVVVLSSAAEDVEIRYGVGLSPEFAASGTAVIDAVPVHYLAVSKLSAGHVATRDADALYVVDRGVSDLNFSAYLNTSGSDVRTVGVGCKAHDSATEAAPTIDRMSCQFARVNEITLEGDVKVIGDHKELFGDRFYGFAASQSHGTELVTEVANALYNPCSMSTVKAPQGLKFLRHLTNVPGDAAATPRFTASRLSAQCQLIGDRPAVETRSQSQNVKLAGSHTATVDIASVEGRTADRLQIVVWHFKTTPNDKIEVRVVLPSGRILPATGFAKEEAGYSKYVVTFAGVVSEILGKTRVEIDGTGVTDDDVGIEATAFYR